MQFNFIYNFNLLDNLIVLVILILFFGLTYLIIKFIKSHVAERKRNSDKMFITEEYLPSEELQSIRQMFYLAMMAAFFIIVLYNLVANGKEILYLSIFDVIISIIALYCVDTNTWYKKVVFFFLMPIGSIASLLTNQILLLNFLDIGHFIAAIIAIRIFYVRFRRYTSSNGLGYTILLLFVIILISSFYTSFVESKNLLDSLVMVSNAFTSNGYAILGSTTLGKINSLLLVWSGYILSGVGTATLTVAILKRHFDKRFNELEEKLNKNNEKE